MPNTAHSNKPHASGVHIKSPWNKNSVRRRWTRITFAFITVFVAILVFLHLAHPQETATFSLGTEPLILLGFISLPLLYPLGQALGASRTTALWAMAIQGANIAWLVHVRNGEFVAALPLLTILMLFCYLKLADERWWWAYTLGLLALVVVGITGYVDAPLPISGILMGMGLHSIFWARQKEGGRNILHGIGLFTLAWLIFAFFVWKQSGFAINATFWTSLANCLVLTQAWLLPLLAAPLLWMALFSDPAARWRPNPQVTLFALIFICSVCMIAFAPMEVFLCHLTGFAPLAALWLAMGLARVQAKTPAWCWMPIGVILVVTTLPQSLVSAGLRWSKLPDRVENNRELHWNLAQPDDNLLIPLYTFISHELVGESRLTLDIPPSAP